MGIELNDLKREVFYRLMDMAGRVFVLVRYSDLVVIGRRGFTEEEKKNGIILVFNHPIKFIWDSSGIHATLVFAAPEKCYIPPEDVVAVYSPDLRVRLSTEPVEAGDEERRGGASLTGESPGGEVEAGEPGNIIKVDFTKRGLQDGND